VGALVAKQCENHPNWLVYQAVDAVYDQLSGTGH
jgi:hypothetical protein